MTYCEILEVIFKSFRDSGMNENEVCVSEFLLWCASVGSDKVETVILPPLGSQAGL